MTSHDDAPTSGATSDAPADRGAELLRTYLDEGTFAARCAQDVMRSRFAAFREISSAVRAQDAPRAEAVARYLHGTWAPDTRPPLAELLPDGPDAYPQAAAAAVEWTRLHVLDVVEGEGTGEVEFVASFVPPGGRRDRVHERSRFRREPDGRWVYVDGDVRA